MRARTDEGRQETWQKEEDSAQEREYETQARAVKLELEHTHRQQLRRDRASAPYDEAPYTLRAREPESRERRLVFEYLVFWERVRCRL